MTKPRKKYRPRPIVSDPLALARHQASKLSPERQQDILRKARDAFDLLRAGKGTVEAWQDMADALNISEALVELRIGSNMGRMVDGSQLALAELHQRVASGGSWTMRAGEITALDDGIWLYAVQIRECSAGEYRRAEDTVRNKIAQALAGNAGAGVAVHGAAAGEVEAA